MNIPQRMWIIFQTKWQLLWYSNHSCNCNCNRSKFSGANANGKSVLVTRKTMNNVSMKRCPKVYDWSSRNQELKTCSIKRVTSDSLGPSPNRRKSRGCNHTPWGVFKWNETNEMYLDLDDLGYHCGGWLYMLWCYWCFECKTTESLVYLLPTTTNTSCWWCSFAISTHLIVNNTIVSS